MKKNLMMIAIIMMLSVTYSFAELNIDYLTLSGTEFQSDKNVQNIALSIKNEIAICFFDQKVNVYDLNGRFLRGYSFKTDGSCYIKFDLKGNLQLYIVRGSELRTYSVDGVLLKKEKITDWRKVNDLYSEFGYNHTIETEDAIFNVESPFGNTTFKKTDKYGDEVVIYELGSSYVVLVVKFTLWLVCGILVVWGVIKEGLKARKKNQQ